MRTWQGDTWRGAAVLAAVLLLATPAVAQFNDIFGNQAPIRPPAPIDIPDQAPEDEDIPDIPLGPGRVLPAPPPQVQRPGPVQSQPFPPPPGGQQAPPATANAPSGPGVQPPGAQPPPGQPPLAGLPPGQRQPRGDGVNTPPGTAALQPGDEVVVEPPAEKIVNDRAAFSGLDKITGRIIKFDAAIGETVQFGALRVTPRACYTRPPTQSANTTSFIEVDEITLKGEVKRIYSGWMFAASPGLHAVEHPIYDVWLTDCKQPENAVADAGKPAPADAAAPAPRKPPAPRVRPQTVR